MTHLKPAPAVPRVVTYDGDDYQLWEGRILLNWRHRPVLTRPRPCRICRGPAYFADDQGRPVHKVCLEIAITADLLTPAETTRWEQAA